MAQPLARPLDRAEAFFWLLDRCSSMNFAILAEGSGTLDPGRLEEALARAARIHPALAVAIEADSVGRLAFVPRPRSRAGFSREESGDDWHEALSARLAQPFDLGEAPLLRAHWFGRPGGRWAFAIVFHHSIGDGRSGFRLVADLIDDARGIPVPSTPFEPKPSLMELFPEALAGAAGHEKAQAWKASLRREALRPAALAGFARKDAPVRPAIVPVRLDEAIVAGLSRRARELGASVHGLVGAAELMAARDHFDAGGTPALMLTSPVDLRGNLAAPVDDATPGFYVTLLSSIAKVPESDGIGALAKFLTDDLRRQVAQGCGHLFYHLTPAAEAIPATHEGIAGFSAYLQRMPTAFVLSNVGRVAAMPEAGGVRVDEVSFALCPMAHQPLFVAASTWGGRLALNVVHDANRLEAQAARAIADAMAALLSRAARLTGRAGAREPGRNAPST